MASRNPPWTYEELILALDLYKRRSRSLSKDSREVAELSDVLNALPIHSDRPDRARFRNHNSVYMKLSNFARLDPDYSGRGLSRGNKLERLVWDEYALDSERLRQTARALRSFSGDAVETAKGLPNVAESDGSEEGKLLLRIHRNRERNVALVRRKKERASRRSGRLTCEVCGFDFVSQYGGLGRQFIERHHLLPLAMLRPGQRTRLTDLALVCANCHRMLHRSVDPSNLDGLRATLKLAF